MITVKTCCHGEETYVKMKKENKEKTQTPKISVPYESRDKSCILQTKVSKSWVEIRGEITDGSYLFPKGLLFFFFFLVLYDCYS